MPVFTAALLQRNYAAALDDSTALMGVHAVITFIN